MCSDTTIETVKNDNLCNVHIKVDQRATPRRPIVFQKKAKEKCDVTYSLAVCIVLPTIILTEYKVHIEIHPNGMLYHYAKIANV